MTPALRPVHATPQQRAAALAWLTQHGFAGMGAMTYADQAATVADRLARLRDVYADDPEVRRLTEEVGRAHD